MKKKLLALVLSVVMLVAILVPALAINAEGVVAKVGLGDVEIQELKGVKYVTFPVVIAENSAEMVAIRYYVISEDGLAPYNFRAGTDFAGTWEDDFGDVSTIEFGATVNKDGADRLQILHSASKDFAGVICEGGTLGTAYFVAPTEIGTYTFKIEVIDASMNVRDAAGVKAKAAEIGYTTQTISYTVECTDHTPGAAEQTKAPTCTEKGEEVVKCTVCEKVLETKEVAALGHKAGEATQTKAPTCTDKGAEEVKCTVCQAVIETKDVAALGHDMVADDAANKAPTCTEAGVKNAKKCSRCDHKTSDVATALGHAWDNGTVDGDAKCGETADVTYKCLNCGEERVETGAKVEHAMVADEANSKAATCTEAGVEATKCSREGCTHTETEAIKALGHDMVADEANSKAATCTEDGVEATKCSRCDVTETKVIKAAHKPGEKEITKEPTTTEKGEAIIKCTVCGEVIETIELDVKSPETSDNANVVVFAVVALVAAAALVVVGKKRFAL